MCWAASTEGLRIERIHTTPGVHPYDEVEWARRDVVMTNWRDGSVNFEQRGVEFPDFWSVNAVNIVTSKYFRGAVGTPQREVSLKQLIDRIVKTYRKAGEDHKYFASPADAEIFEHELAYALLHQIFSFNSPVWFNVGTPQPQQVSACFILSVDDSMESILDWYKEEASSVRRPRCLRKCSCGAYARACFHRWRDDSAVRRYASATRASCRCISQSPHLVVGLLQQPTSCGPSGLRGLREHLCLGLLPLGGPTESFASVRGEVPEPGSGTPTGTEGRGEMAVEEAPGDRSVRSGRRLLIRQALIDWSPVIAKVVYELLQSFWS
ncbi:hypothetical protein AQI88_38895 [Streptomyces cellostaticus]|uniref:Ribonucleotide reductase class II vitamin B12-dependent N-terminal domain-containing protein n=1 Tax=Streptomyces cellostaticus TaxID=67285 RepID=A0A101NBZ7_9ACTN|nr:hypothetical protein AQI88_38895 [Streptomyces cellostaticus]